MTWLELLSPRRRRARAARRRTTEQQRVAERLIAERDALYARVAAARDAEGEAQ